MNYSSSTRLQCAVFGIVLSAALASCGLFSKKNGDDNSPAPTNKPTTGQTTDGEKQSENQTARDGMFTCGSTSCKSGGEFCVTQRFTPGGKIIENACHALASSCKDADCAHASLAAPLKDLPCSSFTDQTDLSRIQIILHFVDPDVLPLANKLADKVSSLKVKFKSTELINKIGDRKLFYIEGGKIKNAPSEDLHCSLLNAGGFMTLEVPYEIDTAKFRERILLGSRNIVIYFDTTNIAFDCTHNGDTTPFVVDDLKTIFGALADITVE